MLPTEEQVNEFAALSPAARREANKNPRNFLLFFSYYYLEYLKYRFAPFHDDFASDLADLHDGIITRLVWCTAADTAKTSFAQAWLVWNIVNKAKNYPNVDSHDRANSERFLFETINHLQTNDRIKADYGNLFNSTRSRIEEKQEKRLDSFVTENDVRCEAHTTQESLRGRKHFADRPDCFIVDDFETLPVVRSEVSIAEVASHLSELKRGMAQTGTWQLYLCNYLSEIGNVAQMEKDARLDPKMRFRKIKRIGEGGKPTWPERDVMTDEDLKRPENFGKVSIETKMREMRKEDTGDSDWMREMQLEPVDPTGDGPDKQGYSALFPMSVFDDRIVNEPFLNSPPYALGVDPSGDGEDSSVVAKRSAFQASVHAKEKKSTGKSVASLTVSAMMDLRIPPQSVVLDAFGVGFKATQELGLLEHRIKAVNVGELEVCRTDGYLNDRAYMYFMLRDWLAQGGKIIEYLGVREQLKSIRFIVDENGKRRILSKKEIKKRSFRSPDELDAIAMTFLTELKALKRDDEKEKPKRPFGAARFTNRFNS